jgi:Carboxypeptidase regulatory-like domain
MTTEILVGLIVVLLAAAAYVGVLLVRRTRSARAAAEPGAERPRTVADLVKRRRAPSDDTPAEISGDELFVPVVPRQDGVAVPAAPGDVAAGPAGATAAPSPQPATPAGGLEVGDAPWRRAARMTGAEPGGAWETAPIPVVAAPRNGADASADGASEVRTDGADGATTSASSSVVIVSRAAAPTAASLWTELEAMRAAAVRPEPAVTEREIVDDEPSPWTEPAAPTAPTGFDPLPTPRTDVSEPVAADAAVEPESPEAEAAPVSRPLSDPDLTPLMGIPIIRPAAEVVVPDPVVPEAVPEVLDEPAAAPVPRVTAAPAADDDVVFLLPPTSSFPVVAPVASGSPQPVWFRVVRRDGEPVDAAVVALLDGHGREVDTTKTATDGGGELHTPHGGRFLMIVSADGYQPRATLLTVDAEPVELALLLPRSATVSGSVRAGDEMVRDARVVVRQDHDVVDEALTAGDGHYRFDDLAEGSYTVAATGGPGGAVARVSLAEGADVQVDLDLR